MKMVVNLRLILYVLPTLLISKIPLELIKKQVRQYNFSDSDQSNMVHIVAQKSPRKKKLDEVSAIGIKSKLTLVPVKLLPGRTDKFPVGLCQAILAKNQYIRKDMPSLYPVLDCAMK